MHQENQKSISQPNISFASGVHSYKKIFNKNILWVKLYDNYLYNYLNKNTKNNFSILKPKTNITLTISKENKVQINKNTIKLLNINNNEGMATHPLVLTEGLVQGSDLLTKGVPLAEGLEIGVVTKKEIKLYKYINTISEYNNETVKYQNIVYQFNKNNKGKQNSSVGINKNVFRLLESTFLSMSSLISKPIIVITPNKVIIQLFYYLNNFYNSNTLPVAMAAGNRDGNNKLLNINNDKLQSLCLNLYKIYKKPVELELDRLHYPYYDSNILSNMIGLISNIVKLRFIIKKLFTIAKIKKTNNFSNKSSIIPSYLSGFKIRVAGRLLTQRVIPRLTVKTIQRGTLARGKAKFVDSARFTNKNKRGSFSITVTMGHVFF